VRARTRGGRRETPLEPIRGRRTGLDQGEKPGVLALRDGARVSDQRAPRAAVRPASPLLMQVYALTSSHSPSETLDLFLTREAAESELREILEDEPDWRDVLRVVPIELDGQQMSSNSLMRRTLVGASLLLAVLGRVAAMASAHSQESEKGCNVRLKGLGHSAIHSAS
jgi:hypothetical protein